MTGSFCTWAKVLPVMEELAGTYDVFPILSPISYVSDNRFGKAADWIDRSSGVRPQGVAHDRGGSSRSARKTCSTRW